ncbi:MAG: amino acid ABC transporter substrate-binding protein, partial [Kiloniellales bacterium]
MDLGKRLLAVATLAGFVFAAPMTPAQADKVDDVINAGKVRCAVVLDFPPIGYRDANNEPA